MNISFEYAVIRENEEGELLNKVLEITCDVQVSFEEEGESHFVTPVSCTDWNGEEIDLTKREQEEVNDIAVNTFIGED